MRVYLHLVAITLASLALTGCGSSSTPEPTNTPTSAPILVPTNTPAPTTPDPTAELTTAPALLVQPETAQQPEPATQDIEEPSAPPVPVTTAAQSANLRGGPGTDYDVVGGVTAGQALEVTHTNTAGDWYRLASGAWIFGTLISNAPGDPPVTTDYPALPAPIQPVAEPQAPEQPAEPMAAPPLPPPAGANVRCETFGADELCVWVSNASPPISTDVVVYARYSVNGVSATGQAMRAIWRYKTTSPECSGTTNGEGVAQCSRNIGRPSAGHQVNIAVTIAGRTVVTHFTP